jgi:hypothetical protein
VTKTLFFALFLLAVALTVNAISYANFITDYGFLRLKQQAVSTGWYLPFYYSHVLVSGLVLLSGFVQITPKIRQRFPAAHRMLGKFYVFGILFFAAPGALVMSFFIERGPVVLASFLLQTLLWFSFTAKAFKSATEKDFAQHELWMMRSFALALAAVTLRLYVFVASFAISLNSPWAYGMIAWLSWVPNLMIVEWIYSAAKLVKASPDRSQVLSEHANDLTE